MKNIFIKLLFPTTLLLAVACGSELEVEPQDVVSEEVARNSPQYREALAVGAYDRLADSDVYGGWIQMTSDLLGTNDNLRWSGTFFDPRAMFNKEVVAINGQVEVTWTDTYQAINVCNEVLAEVAQEEDSALQAKYEGEAKFIRGALYFELVRLFGKDWSDGDPAANLGVPLKLEPTDLTYDSEANLIDRNTVAEVYTQVLADLTDAIALLPEENFGAGNKNIFATSWAAKAMLARVHLQRQEYDEARVLANDVIENGPFQLIDRVDRVYNQSINTSEDIFALQITNQDQSPTGVSETNSFQTFYADRSFGGRRDMRILGTHLALYDSTDDRRTLLFYEVGGNVFSGKYQDQFANISILRLAEMYLIRAEGNLLAGGTQVGPNTPGADLQVLRARSNAPAASDTPTIEDIMLERKLELCFEGHFLHDIRRRQATITQQGEFPWTADVLVMPIPQRELDANPALRGQQNPGYSED